MFEKMYKTRKIVLLIAFVMISSLVYSQDKKIEFGASFNARITHQIFDEPENNKSDDQFSYAIIGSIYYYLSSKFQLISGLSFSHYKINQLDDFPRFACDFSSSLSYIPYNSYFKENYKTDYLGIPLEGRLGFGDKANRFFIQFGFEGLFKVALNETVTLVECGASEREVSWPTDFKEVNNFLLLVKLGVGYELQIGEKIKLFFEPNVEYSLSKFFKSSSGNSTLINFGLNTGVKF